MDHLRELYGDVQRHVSMVIGVDELARISTLGVLSPISKNDFTTAQGLVNY